MLRVAVVVKPRADLRCRPGLYKAQRERAVVAPPSEVTRVSDLAKHIVIAYQEDKGFNPRDTLRRIKAGFEAELDSPTDEPSGHIER